MIKDVIPCGTTVKTVIGGICGMITGVCIRFDDVQYEISYFAAEEEKSVWMRPQQFVAHDFSLASIGFNTRLNGKLDEQVQGLWQELERLRNDLIG